MLVSVSATPIVTCLADALELAPLDALADVLELPPLDALAAALVVERVELLLPQPAPSRAQAIRQVHRTPARPADSRNAFRNTSLLV